MILSASTQRRDVQHALDSGAVGYIPKDTTSAIMLSALRLIMAGGVYTPPEMVQQQSGALNTSDSHASLLTPRQMEVLRLLIEWASNKVIAAQLDLAEATVKMHVTAILNALGVSNRTQAVVAAEKRGLYGLPH